MAVLDLYLHDRFVGTVAPDPRTKTRVTLAVDPAYEPDGDLLLSEAFAVIPGRPARTDAVSNFLGGYVPEGNHRERMAAKRRIESDDLFALLDQFGGSVAGAVTLRQRGDGASSTPRYEPLDDRSLDRILRQAVSDSDQGIPDDSRSTLPGYQPKVLVARDDETWLYPHGRAPSTWILKPQVPARPSRLFDEYYSHELSRRVGLSGYRSHLGRAGRTTYLAIERFDRDVVDGTVSLRHQEDLAQGLSLDWLDSTMKFQEPDWPTDPRRASAGRIAELLGSIPGGDAAVETWLRQLVFHVTIGNNDAHAKNVALMHLPTGTELSQLYDAVPNLFQDGVIAFDLALAVNGVFDHRRMSAEHLVAEATSWKVLAGGRAEAIVADMLAALDDAVHATEPPGDASPSMADRVLWNVERLRGGVEISEPKR